MATRFLCVAAALLAFACAKPVRRLDDDVLKAQRELSRGSYSDRGSDRGSISSNDAVMQRYGSSSSRGSHGAIYEVENEELAASQMNVYDTIAPQLGPAWDLETQRSEQSNVVGGAKKKKGGWRKWLPF